MRLPTNFPINFYICCSLGWRSDTGSERTIVSGRDARRGRLAAQVPQADVAPRARRRQGATFVHGIRPWLGSLQSRVSTNLISYQSPSYYLNLLLMGVFLQGVGLRRRRENGRRRCRWSRRRRAASSPSPSSPRCATTPTSTRRDTWP